MTTRAPLNSPFVHWFRQSSPYIHVFRGRTFVITFGGEAIRDSGFAHLIHDVTLLSNLGIRLVLVHGARPQIETRMHQAGHTMRYVEGIRITDTQALSYVKEAVGAVRMEIEALFSMGLANSPMAGVRIRVAAGNFVTARPVGIRNGIDFQHTGEVRRIDVDALRHRLDDGSIVLVSPIGYSPTGEIFNLSALEVATEIAAALQADKLLCLTEFKGIRDKKKRPLRQLRLGEVDQLLRQAARLEPDAITHLQMAVKACRHQVRRVHLLDRHIDGALLQELFTRDGIGTLVSADSFENTRPATIEDVGGILELIKPLEEDGVLVRRSREQLELEITHFHVIERDGTIIACAALYPFAEERAAELACLAVHADYQNAGRGAELLAHLEALAKKAGIDRLFALTTRTTHWFREQGFVAADISALPVKKQALYNFQRNSRVLTKALLD